MAINFPSTAGQATDGTFTYVVAGITYSWNGESWTAAGSGATATDLTVFSVTQNAVGTATLSYNNSSGVFSYTPPDLSGYLTAEADTLADVTGRGSSTTNSIAVGGLQLGTLSQLSNAFGNTNTLKFGGDMSMYHMQDGIHGTSNWIVVDEHNLYIGTKGEGSGSNLYTQLITIDVGNDAYTSNTAHVKLGYGAGGTKLETTSTGVTISGALTAGGLTYPNTNGTSGDVLTSDGAGNVTWTTPSGLQSRTTVSASGSVANGGVLNTTFTTPKTYALLKIETSHAAWVTLYTDTTSRTNDANRAETTDPIPGSGVIAEVITSGAVTQLISPGTIAYNSAGSGTTYAKVVNKSGSTANVVVTLHYVQLEV